MSPWFARDLMLSNRFLASSDIPEEAVRSLRDAALSRACSSRFSLSTLARSSGHSSGRCSV